MFRFDGIKFLSWQPTDGTQWSPGAVTKLLGARDGALWIGTEHGLASWRDQRLTVYSGLADEYVAALAEDRERRIWVGTVAGPRGNARLCMIADGALLHCDGEDGRFGRFVLSLHPGSDGSLWVGAASGVWQWTGRTSRVYATSQSMAEIHAIAEDQAGGVWVAVNRGIERLVGDRFEPVTIAGVEGDIKPTTLLGGRDNGMWIGTQDRGLLRVERRATDGFTRLDGLSGDLVTALIEDVEHNIWIATSNGLDQFHDLAVATVGTRQRLSSDTVVSVLSVRDGSVLVGTINGLNRSRDDLVTREQLPNGPTREGVGSMVEDVAGRVWISSRVGLEYFDGRWSQPIGRFADGYVHAFAAQPDDTIWVSDQERGLFHIRLNRTVEAIPWARLGGNARSMIYDDSASGLWLGFFHGGLAFIQHGSILRSYGTSDGMGRGEVGHLRFDDEHALWAATQSGISRLKDGRITTLTVANGLPCESIRWTIEDKRRSLWLQAACGLVRIERPEIEAWIRDPMHVIRLSRYDSADGVPDHSSPSSYSPVVTRSSDGRLWFTTYDGIAVVDPDHLPFNGIAPPVHIETLVADRRVYDPTKEITLPPFTRDLRIEYAALSLTAPDKVRFRYRLDGRDPDWIDAGNRRHASYTDLSPGQYRFRVIASNNDGVSNDVGGASTFSIRAAFYQTEVFRIGVLVALLFGTWLVHRLRLANLTQRLHVRFEERLAERTRIARELHDTLLQDALSVSMQLSIIAATVTEPGIRAKLDHVLARLSQLHVDGRHTIDTLRTPEAPYDDSLELALARDAELIRADRNVTIRVIVEGQPRGIHPVVRDELYRIGREALVNALNHARPNRVDIGILYAPDEFVIRLRDDGCGMTSEVLDSGKPGHWGLVGMRERAERIGAKMRVLSSASTGTEVEVVVPAQFAFGSARRTKVPQFDGNNPPSIV